MRAAAHSGVGMMHHQPPGRENQGVPVFPVFCNTYVRTSHRRVNGIINRIIYNNKRKTYNEKGIHDDKSNVWIDSEYSRYCSLLYGNLRKDPLSAQLTRILMNSAFCCPILYKQAWKKMYGEHTGYLNTSSRGKPKEAIPINCE